MSNLLTSPPTMHQTPFRIRTFVGIDRSGQDQPAYAQRVLLEQSWCRDIYHAKYRHVCVDEAPDLNKSQYEFIRAFCGSRISSVFFVGDPNQMIYGFNGSSQDFLCKHFQSDFSLIKLTLPENFRCSRSVIRIADRLKPGSQTESEFAIEGKSEIKQLADETPATSRKTSGWLTVDALNCQRRPTFPRSFSLMDNC